MQKTIRRLCLLGTLAIALLFTVAGVCVYGVSQREATRAFLQNTIAAAASRDLPAAEECADWAGRIAAEDANLRVTVLNGAGDVLYDTDALAAQSASHARREEIDEALSGAWGSARRQSETTGVRTLYVARKLSDGLLLRLGYPLNRVYPFLYVLLGVSALLCLLVALAARWFSGPLIARLTKPLRLIDDLLGGREVRAEEVYPEARPLLQDIDTRVKKLNYDLDEIRKTQRVRQDFVANASHELKSPLTAIKGFAELLEADMVADAAQKKDYLGRIVFESNRLLAIIEDILHLSQAESGPAEDVASIDLRHVTDEIIASLKPLAAQKGITLEAAGSGAVRANAQEMWELLYNLIDNGIRYGKTDGYVRVRLTNQSIVVVDDGIGIPQKQLPRIFERFYRVDKAHSRAAVGGTGLGLSIVRHVAQKYGGAVEVQSVEGEGSTFTVRLWQ